MFPRILLADDHVLVAEGLQRLLSSIGEVKSVHSGEDLVAEVERDTPDVVVADISLGETSGLDAMSALLSCGHAIPFVILTMYAQPEVAIAAMEAGASAFVVKSAAGESLLAAVRAVLEGQTYIAPQNIADAVRTRTKKVAPALLTDRQRAVLELVVRGLRARAIAAELGLSVRTVDSHKAELLQRFNVRNTIELLYAAQRAGYCEFPTANSPPSGLVAVDLKKSYGPAQ